MGHSSMLWSFRDSEVGRTLIRPDVVQLDGTGERERNWELTRGEEVLKIAPVSPRFEAVRPKCRYW